MTNAPDPNAVLARYRQCASGYDASALRGMPIRARAIALLQLRPGQVVLDAGCGTGLSFGALCACVGETGRVIGVDASPDMLQRARARCESSGWRNVTLIESAVEALHVDAKLDAILLHYAHDVLRSPAAVERIFAAARPGARVVAAGLKYFPWYLAPLNPWVRARARPYATTLEGLAHPWDLLARRLDDFTLESRNAGSGYIAAGRLRQ